MSRISPSSGETVEATPRKAMTTARKHAIWLAHDGRCADCRRPVPMVGEGVIYDHDVQLWLGGAEDDAQVRPLCSTCNVAKTAADATTRGHVKRLIRKNTESRPPSRLKSRGFDRSRARKFSGKVVERKQ
jgi:5-methylcytosine-specific restriction endonuclease McrA